MRTYRPRARFVAMWIRQSPLGNLYSKRPKNQIERNLRLKFVRDLSSSIAKEYPPVFQTLHKWQGEGLHLIFGKRYLEQTR